MKSSRCSAHGDSKWRPRRHWPIMENGRTTPRSTAADLEKRLPHSEPPGPSRAVRHSGPCRSRFWTTGGRDSRAHYYIIMYSSSILFLSFSSFFPIAYSLTVYLAPVPVYAAAITASLPKGKQKQANRRGQWTSFVPSVPLFFGHLHPARPDQRTYIPCLFSATFKRSPTSIISLSRLLFLSSPSR